MIMRGKRKVLNAGAVNFFRFNEAAHDHARKDHRGLPGYERPLGFNEAAHDHARKVGSRLITQFALGLQ